MKLALVLATLLGACDFAKADCECRVFGQCGLSSDYTCCRGGADADANFCPPRARATNCAEATNALGQNPCHWAPRVNCVETGNTAADCLNTCAVAAATVTTPASGGGAACVGDYTCVAGDGACSAAVIAVMEQAVVVTQDAQQALANAEAAVGPPCVPGDPCSPLQPPGPDGVALVAPSLEAAITLDADIASIGTEGSDTYNTFVETFEADMAAVLNVDAEQVEVTSVEPGSISCGFTVRPSGGTPVTPTDLAASFQAPGVSLGGVQTAVALAVEDIVQQAAACNSPEILETVLNCTTFALENAEGIANFTLDLQEAISSAENPEDVGTIAREQVAIFFEMRAEFCDSTCAVPLGPQWAMCDSGLYMIVQMRTALSPFAGLITSLSCPAATGTVGGASPSASALGSGGGDSESLSIWDKLLRVLLAALGFTLIIGAGCFARWGPVPNRFSAGSSGDKVEGDEETANPTAEDS